jgi:ribosomal protein S3AE
VSKTTKKVRDKWRTKEWYSVYTPAYFGEQNVAGIPCEDPKKLIGRVVETTLYDITNDFSHQSIKLYFLVTSITSRATSTRLTISEALSGVEVLAAMGFSPVEQLTTILHESTS